MDTPLHNDLTLALASGGSKAKRLMQLLSQGSSPDLNEQGKWIVAQEDFLTTDPDTLKMKDRAVKLAPLDSCVIIRGESGTGKELVAQILHGARKGNFVAVNMTAITDTLFESELFGHVKGAFTGAVDNRSGLISHANEGTLFLDEIGDLPLSLQPKLLRVIQTRQYRLVGSNQSQQVKCRFIAATHMNLEEQVRLGKFRSDLYYRLATFEVHIKPLRERRGDIPLLVKDPELLAYLANRDFPGNVRELESIVKRWEVLKEI